MEEGVGGTESAPPGRLLGVTRRTWVTLESERKLEQKSV